MSEIANLKDFLDGKVEQYNQQNFIKDDPISIPHQFTKKQDIEIMALWASLLAWGQRKTIINKCHDLLERMDNAPYDFIINHKDEDLKKMLGFKHRTFNEEDTLYFIQFFKNHYQQHDSLEQAFTRSMSPEDDTIENALIGFREYFFSLDDAPKRTQKHVATPARKSACKRLCMFLRWMVRDDNNGVDFGIWKTIKPSQLICPLDVHVDRVGRKLNLLARKQTDWQATLELTNNLKEFDTNDPVKYDFALFGLGLEKYFD